MPSKDDIIKDGLARFLQVQTWIEAAEKEEAQKTVNLLMQEYRYEKALLQNLGVSLDEVDRLKR